MTQPPQNDSTFTPNPMDNDAAATEPVANDFAYANPAGNDATVTEPVANNFAYANPASADATATAPVPNNFAYPNPAYNAQPAPYGAVNPMQPAKKGAGLAIAGLVLAILGLLGSWIPLLNFGALAIAVIGLIFGIIGLVLALKGTHGGKGLSIAAIIVSVLAVGVVIVSNIAYSAVLDEVNQEVQREIQRGADDFESEIDKMSGDATEDILANSLDVKIGTFEIKEDEYWTDTKLPVTITNKLSEARNFSITVEATDADGNRLDTDMMYVDKLGPGQSYSDDLFYFVSQDEIEKYKNATFTVIEATESDY